MLEKLLLQNSSIAHDKSDVSHDSLVVFCNEVNILILFYIKKKCKFIFIHKRKAKEQKN